MPAASSRTHSSLSAFVFPHVLLFEQLRELEAAGVVRRAVFDEVPPNVEYSLTPTGAELTVAWLSKCRGIRIRGDKQSVRYSPMMVNHVLDLRCVVR
ncbi:winged helix-turn-helix transcriptional regulator [Archangium gephyra]|nr:winged helix-turn-helix transcriptional regulator [Archangium gephyra]